MVTGNYLKVRIPPGRARNEWVDVRITAANEAGMVGRIGLLNYQKQCRELLGG